MASQETAETLALSALAWIAGDDERLTHFLNASGTRAADLSARVQDVEFLASVLDFLLLDDTWIIAFCDAEGLAYQRPAEARAALPGGAEPHWT